MLRMQRGYELLNDRKCLQADNFKYVFVDREVAKYEWWSLFVRGMEIVRLKIVRDFFDPRLFQ